LDELIGRTLLATFHDPLRDLFRYDVHTAPKLSGGFGEICFAQDLLFGTEIALKIISFTRLVGDDADATLRSFQKEAVAQARFGQECPNIVRVFDIGRINGTLYYTMEIMDGGNIEALVGRITFSRAREVTLQVVEALNYAHDRGIVHSDVKPANILTNATKQVFKLSDFGLLKILESTVISRGSGSLLVGGTEYYLPVSHRLHPDQIDKATDVYATALLFHRLLTGDFLRLGNRNVLEIPPVIQIAHESRAAHDSVRRMLNDFITDWNHTLTIADLKDALIRLSR
jgi:serine/threonine protein kinase